MLFGMEKGGLVLEEGDKVLEEGPQFGSIEGRSWRKGDTFWRKACGPCGKRASLGRGYRGLEICGNILENGV